MKAGRLTICNARVPPANCLRDAPLSTPHFPKTKPKSPQLAGKIPRGKALQYENMEKYRNRELDPTPDSANILCITAGTKGCSVGYCFPAGMLVFCKGITGLLGCLWSMSQSMAAPLTSLLMRAALVQLPPLHFVALSAAFGGTTKWALGCQ